MNKSICVQDLGLKDYKTTWDFQEELFKNTVDCKIKNRRQDAGLPTPNHFLFVSHPHVYTLGKSGDFSNLLLNEDQLFTKLTEEEILHTTALDKWSGIQFWT